VEIFTNTQLVANFSLRSQEAVAEHRPDLRQVDDGSPRPDLLQSVGSDMLKILFSFDFHLFLLYRITVYVS
jgi:hypothetical protein